MPLLQTDYMVTQGNVQGLEMFSFFHNPSAACVKYLMFQGKKQPRVPTKAPHSPPFSCHTTQKISTSLLIHSIYISKLLRKTTPFPNKVVLFEPAETNSVLTSHGTGTDQAASPISLSAMLSSRSSCKLFC